MRFVADADGALCRCQPVARRGRNGLGLQEPHTVRLPSAQQQAHELQVVVRRGDEPAASAAELRDNVAGEDRLGSQRSHSGVKTIDARAAVPFLWPNPKVCVAHVERQQDAIQQEVAERLARDPFGKNSKHGSRIAVEPELADVGDLTSAFPLVPCRIENPNLRLVGAASSVLKLLGPDVGGFAHREPVASMGKPANCEFTVRVAN
jgi:hypothetical protein